MYRATRFACTFSMSVQRNQQKNKICPIGIHWHCLESCESRYLWLTWVRQSDTWHLFAEPIFSIPSWLCQAGQMLYLQIRNINLKTTKNTKLFEISSSKIFYRVSLVHTKHSHATWKFLWSLFSLNFICFLEANGLKSFQSKFANLANFEPLHLVRYQEISLPSIGSFRSNVAL